MDKVVFYNQTELAYNISKAVYPKVKDAPGLIPGSEYDFAEAIYMFKWQSIYERLKENQSIERERIISFLEGYGYEISDHYDEIIDCLAGSDPMVLNRLNLTGSGAICKDLL